MSLVGWADRRVAPTTLRSVAAVVAGIVAGIHLFHPQLGFPRLLLHLQVGTLFDPRPLLFTITGALIILGILLVYNGVFVRQVYLAGIAVMLLLLVGYVAWHTVLQHGGFWPHLPTHSHADVGLLDVVVIHLVDDTVALISKVCEVALIVVLTVLYRIDEAD